MQFSNSKDETRRGRMAPVIEVREPLFCLYDTLPGPVMQEKIADGGRLLSSRGPGWFDDDGRALSPIVINARAASNVIAPALVRSCSCLAMHARPTSFQPVLVLQPLSTTLPADLLLIALLFDPRIELVARGL